MVIPHLLRLCTWNRGNRNNRYNRNNQDDRPSLNDVSRNEANRLARMHGFRDAHEFKEAFVGQVARFNMKVNTRIGEIFLEGLQNRIQIPTGLFRGCGQTTLNMLQ